MLLIGIPSILIMILAFFIGARIFENNFVSQEIEIPDIEKMYFDDAKKLLEDNNLYISVEGRIHNDEIEKNYIISQHPEKAQWLSLNIRCA